VKSRDDHVEKSRDDVRREGSPACPLSVRAICSLDARAASVVMADRELLARVSFLSFTGSPGGSARRCLGLPSRAV